MNESKLAILGGPQAISGTLAPFVSVGEQEAEAAAAVIRGGILSAYIGARGEGFMGGPQVRALEAKAEHYFGVRHAIAVNSWTSGLIAAVGALGIEPGDEVITTPWTMAATATAILHFNGIPVFADINPDTFNIDPSKVETLITSRTRAIIAVDIFGQSADMRALRDIANRYGLKLISDTAQAPGALYDGKLAGTLADIGGYSFNYHKHIHCGEGGILVTNDDWLAQRMRLLRNHAEAVIDAETPAELCNMLGFNFRMGEIEAAIAAIQLDKLDGRIRSRQRAADRLRTGLQGLEGLRLPTVVDGGTHVYYVFGLTLDTEVVGVDRATLVEALRAEGVTGLGIGYQNLHLLPLFRHRIAYGTAGFPWTSVHVSSQVTYGEGLCPVAERLHRETFVGLNLCHAEFGEDDVDLVIGAFRKVWAGRHLLRDSYRKAA